MCFKITMFLLLLLQVVLFFHVQAPDMWIFPTGYIVIHFMIFNQLYQKNECVSKKWLVENTPYYG